MILVSLATFSISVQSFYCRVINIHSAISANRGGVQDRKGIRLLIFY